MIRVLVFVLLVAALGLGFAWLADRPGDLVVTFDGYQYQVTLMVAAVAVAALVAAIMMAWWVLKAIWNSPYTITRYFRVRRRDRGYQALSTGMIAAGAGDALLARQKNKEAIKLIRSDQEPLIQLLEAQTLMLEGNRDAARDKYEQMIDDPETRLLGLRGLYLEAERLGDRQASRHYAARAADLAPQLGWAAESSIEEKVEEGDWDGALKLLEAQKGLQKADRAAANRKRAMVLTAKAMATFDTDFHGARAAALEANRLLPDFVPAAIAAARTYFRGDDIRKGSKLLEAAWKAEPHPELADLYVHARAGDATHDRLARAKRLQSLRTNHVESSLAVARAAMEAQEYALAREEAETSIRLQPRESAFLLLADIEEAQSGNVGKVRQWLSRAVRAPRDPAWLADGVVSDHWAPLSPVTGRLDAFEWRVPVERLVQTIEQLDTEEPETEQALIEVSEAPAPNEAPEAIEAEVVEETPASVDTTTVAEQESEQEPPADTRPPLPANDAVPREFNGEEGTDPAKMPLPDDPGVDPDDEKKNARRFKLF